MLCLLPGPAGLFKIGGAKAWQRIGLAETEEQQSELAYTGDNKCERSLKAEGVTDIHRPNFGTGLSRALCFNFRSYPSIYRLIMLSWVTNGLQKSQTPSWFEDEVSMSFNHAHSDSQQIRPSNTKNLNIKVKTEKDSKPSSSSTSTRRGAGISLLPKLRRAFESATISGSGSFPIKAADARCRSPPEETVFEACESPMSVRSNQSAAHSVAESYASAASTCSYNMSRIDVGNETDSVYTPRSTTSTSSKAASESGSDADSFFGMPFREMVHFGKTNHEATKKDYANVWLLSNDDEINQEINDLSNKSNYNLTSPTGSLRSRVPVLVLSGNPDREILQALAKSETMTTPQRYRNGRHLSEEEEIDFGDDTNLIGDTLSDKLPYVNNPENIPSTEESFLGGRRKNNANSTFMKRFQMGRNRAQTMIGNNLKGMWNSMEGSNQNKSKKTTKRTRRPKKKYTASPSKKKPSLYVNAEDALADLSRYHEKMSQVQNAFSPIKALSRIRDRADAENPVYEPCSSYSHDERSIISSLSNYSSTHGAILPPQLSNSRSADSDGSNKHEQNSSDDQTNGTSGESSSKGFNFKFKSPRNDTPRIIWDEQDDSEEVIEGPRVLYTDDGEVAAIIHPTTNKPEHRRSSSRSSLIQHVFHSELSTLYEESSSLESASSLGAAALGSASSLEANSAKTDIQVQANASGDPSTSSASDEYCSSVSESVTTNGSNSHQGSSTENRPPHLQEHHAHPQQHQQRGRHHQNSRHQHHHHGHHQDYNKPASPSKSINQNDAGSFSDDREVKMRWEYSLGLIDGSDHWRQPMALMNTEELSSDYVAEI